MKKNNGITLIALVITIIVMLILVTVTIRVATTGNLFTHAANAASKTKTAAEKENALLDGNIDGKTIEEIVAEQTGTKTYRAYEVGDTVTLAEQDFYVIEASDEHTDTVKLLAALNVETDSTDTEHYNKQYARASMVSFDNIEPYSNVYADSTIKPKVDSYLSSLGITVQEKRLMLKDEAEALQTGHTDILYAAKSWLGSPTDNTTLAWGVHTGSKGKEPGIYTNTVSINASGLRPLIIILKDNIPAQ